MPDFRFVCPRPTVQPTSGYAVRISQEAWSQHEELVRRLHACGATRDEILRTLINDHGFKPSVGQLRDQLARWGLRSTRKSRTCASSDQGDGSGTSFSGSDTVRETQPELLPLRTPHTYTNVPDEFFSSMWPQFDMGTLQHQKAVEMEMLAEMLFLSGRYFAAFNLYFSIYHATSFLHRFDIEIVTARFRAFSGCLRSSGNAEQRRQIVTLAEKELQNCLGGTYCTPEDIDIRQISRPHRSALMAQFHERENFRSAMSAAEASNVSAVIPRLQVDRERLVALQWCFDRLNTYDFVCLYNGQIQQSGSAWTYGGSQTIIFWFLVVEAAKYPDQQFARFTIRHTSGCSYTFTILETFALVAAMVSAEPWLFSLDQLPPDGLRRWTEKLSTDNTLFDTIFKQAIKSTLIPTLEVRINKTDLSKTAAANGFLASRMPEISLLRSFASKLSQSESTEVSYCDNSDLMEYEMPCSSSPDCPSIESLIHQYSAVIKSYICENRAHGKSYQLNEHRSIKSRRDATTNTARASKGSSRSSSMRSSLVESRDPTLLSTAYDSMSDSFRSFESTHRRTKNGMSRSSQLDSMSIDTNGTSDSSWVFSTSIGVK